MDEFGATQFLCVLPLFTLPPLVIVLIVRRRRATTSYAHGSLPAVEIATRATYATFWQRLGALWVDFLVMLPAVVAVLFVGRQSRVLHVAIAGVSHAVGWAYVMYFHTRWGATPGKMAVRIKIVKELDWDPITLREALLRSSVQLAFSTLSVGATIIAVFSLSEDTFGALSPAERGARLKGATPEWGALVAEAQMLWFWSEVVVMLLNAKRQALHDMIAGTVVIQK